MRITRYSRSSGRGEFHQRMFGYPYQRGRRGGHSFPQFREYPNPSQPPAYNANSYYGHERRSRAVSPDDRLLLTQREDMLPLSVDRESRERYRRERSRSQRSFSRDRSLSSVLSEISSGSSCFGTVRASEAYGSPVYEDLTDDDIHSMEQELSDGSSMDLSIAPPPVLKHKKRKKDKRKKEKAKERERKRAKRERRRQKEILEERICPPDREVAQSKEIFASGQNILVSVSFIDNDNGKERSDRHKKSKRKKTKREKHREKLTVVTKEELSLEETKRSPRKGTTSPSHDHDTATADQKCDIRKPTPTQQDQEQGPNAAQQQPQPSTHQSPQSQPHPKKKKLDPGVKPVMVIDLERSPSGQVISSPKEVIVLSDEEGKKAQRAGKEEPQATETDLNNRGPNTPPEPAPKSPDSYDPFEPTKSSPSTGISRHDIGSISSLSLSKEAKNEFLHHPHGHHHHHHGHHHHHHGHGVPLGPSDHASESAGFANDDSILDLHPESPFDKLDVLASPSRMTTHPTLQYYRHHHQSPMKAIIKSMPKKLLQSSATRESRSHSGAAKNNTGTLGGGGTTSGGATASGGAPFEDELNDGDISPYSPRSSDCDEQMFEPPNPERNGETQTIALTVDNVRKVFGNDPKTLYGDLRKSFQHRSVIAVDEMYKPHKMTLEMLDEIPDSAVDLQVKEKLVQKLQRQERIVEEVKHCLKPHFNKKRIDKDEYKEIMRKSIPKICHSRSGEINPVKIEALITAYVKKAIAKRKLMAGEGSASGTPMANALMGYGLPSTAGVAPVMLANR
ncbi:uncharacterized protein LOC131286698 [Anopheles ziemanni]|uniref:uncharacterized protein LOC131259235 n=1 Tax=Anopheles coustani TaxID=139045 RepID=UPI00265B6260|nr:uncharacterized protein LOC131259235 [Anopheles coustani]XP_058171670.1 uncharacterized protein LOC131286698 [Anopheles ziemanni]